MSAGKDGYSSLASIYGDPQLVALSNRINFIKVRQATMKLPFETTRTLDTFTRQKSLKADSKQLFVKRSLATENEPQPQSLEKFPQNRLAELKVLKSQRYRQVKENTERYKVKIKEKKEKEVRIKRIKRRQILTGQQKCRSRLEAFEQDKIQAVRETKTNAEVANNKFGWKRVELKYQLLQEEARSLHVYEEALSYKSELMHRIRQQMGTAEVSGVSGTVASGVPGTARTSGTARVGRRPGIANPNEVDI